MPCTPSDNKLNATPAPGISIPGYGFPFSPGQVPFPEFELPTDLVEDLVRLMEQLGALFPSGLFKANLDNYMKDALDFIMGILNEIAPYLSLYNLFLAALKLITCIIEVLCAFPNPFSMGFKLHKLFAQCIPNFLAILPWLALIAMILALLLLILALIEYLIQTLLAIILEILENFILLGKALTLLDAEVILAIAQKIASLFCIIENLMAVFVAVAAIMAIIETIAAIAGFSICSDDDTDAGGCCVPENCPPFIADNPDGITGTLGRMVYYRKIESDIASLLGVPAGSMSLPPLRIERWQFLNDKTTQSYPFSSIITPVNTATGKIYFPDIEFDETTPIGRSPYLLDMRVLVNPAVFGHADIEGERYMQIKDCIVVRKPYLGEYDYSNSLISDNVTGTLNIEGGKVYEDDGETPYIINTQQATLNTFIHFDDQISTSLPTYDDGYVFDEVEFTLRPNHEALVFHNLVTLGCFPGVSAEKAVQNAILTAEGLESVNERINLEDILGPRTDGQPGGRFPDILGAQECVVNALNELRQDVTEENIAIFQSTAETCLNNLADEVSAMYCGTLLAGVSQFKSTIEIDVDIQFTTRAIEATVVLKDPGGTIISRNIPDYCLPDVLDRLEGSVTFGEITDFVYDGEESFITYITSENAGEGELTVSFDGKVFNTVTVGVDLDNPSSISTNVIPYTFIDSTTQPAVRRDVTDISNDRD